jgi:protein O-mannosyl-transferase
VETKDLQTESRVATDGAFFSRKRLVAAIACLFFGLPIVYLAVFRALPRTVLASQDQDTNAAGTADIAKFEALAASHPTVENRISLAVAYIDAKQPERAIPVLLAVVAEDKNNAPAWNDLCVANTLQESYSIAIEECRRALVLDPNFQLARNNLKWAEDERKKALLTLADRQTAPVSHDGAFYLAEGLSQLNAGHYDDAIVAWQHALQIDPQNALAANNIGDAYMMKKQPDVALEWFEKALTMDPTLQIAKNNMAWATEEKAKAR